MKVQAHKVQGVPIIPNVLRLHLAEILPVFPYPMAPKQHRRQDAPHPHHRQQDGNPPQPRIFHTHIGVGQEHQLYRLAALGVAAVAAQLDAVGQQVVLATAEQTAVKDEIGDQVGVPVSLCPLKPYRQGTENMGIEGVELRTYSASKSG